MGLGDGWSSIPALIHSKVDRALRIQLDPAVLPDFVLADPSPYRVTLEMKASSALAIAAIESDETPASATLSWIMASRCMSARGCRS